jgi:hypothetical protein
MFRKMGLLQWVGYSVQLMGSLPKPKLVGEMDRAEFIAEMRRLLAE